MAVKRWILVVAAVVVSIGAALYFAPARLSGAFQETAEPGAALPRLPVPSPRTVGTPAGRVALCGYGEYEPTIQHFYPLEVQNGAQAAIARAANAMIGSKNDVERATGLFTMSVTSFQRAYSDKVSEQPNCEKDETCARRVLAYAHAAMAPSTQELARLATSSRSARVYALAWHRCKFLDVESTRPAECSLLTPEQWAQLDPENAVPWLFALDHAPRSDTKARAELLSRASRATFIAHYWDSVFPLAESPELTRLDRATRLVAKTELLGIYAAFPIPGSGAVSQLCSKGALSETSTRATCDQLARLFVEKPDTRFDLAIGLGLAEKLGWQTDRLNALRERRDALEYTSVLIGAGFKPSDLYSCDFLDRMEERVRSLAAYGEVETARRAAAASGKSNAELASSWRTYMAKASERAARESSDAK